MDARSANISAMADEELILMFQFPELLQQATWETLRYRLNQFLLPHGINTATCDVFEETLLNAAGIEKQPTKCFFGSYAKDQSDTLYFAFKNFEFADALQFINYYKSLSTDSAHGIITFDTNTKTSVITVDLQIAYNKLLPAFVKAFSTLPQKKRDAYADLSKEHADVKDYSILQSIMFLLKTTMTLTNNDMKRGLLNMLISQLETVVANYREHQLHSCELHAKSEYELHRQLENTAVQFDKFAEFSQDPNIKTVSQLIAAYHDLKILKQNPHHHDLDMGSNAKQLASSSDSPVSSIVRLFSPPPRSSSSSSTCSRKGSPDSTVAWDSDYSSDSSDSGPRR